MNKYKISTIFFAFLFLMSVLISFLEKDTKSDSSFLEKKPKRSARDSILPDRDKGLTSGALKSRESQVEPKEAQNIKIKTIAELVAQGADIPGVDVDDTMKIGEGFFQLMGLNESETNHLNDVSEEIFTELKEYEFENKELIEESEQKLAYRVESNPDFIEDLQQYLMGEIIGVSGSDGLSILAPALEHVFDDLKLDREISLEFVKKSKDLPFEKIMTTEQSFDKDGDSRGKRSSASMVRKNEPAEAPERYRHLFDVGE